MGSGGSNRVLTLAEAAERIGVAPSTLYKHWREWEDPLAVLQWNWGEAYKIVCKGTDEWIAQRLDNGTILRSDSPAGLRDRILADYFVRPVSLRA